MGCALTAAKADPYAKGANWGTSDRDTWRPHRKVAENFGNSQMTAIIQDAITLGIGGMTTSWVRFLLWEVRGL